MLRGIRKEGKAREGEGVGLDTLHIGKDVCFAADGMGK